MVRYADDFVILCREAEEAEAALRRVTAWIDGQRTDAASRQDAHRRRREAGPGIRVPGLSVRGRASVRAQEEPASVQGQGARQDETHAGRQSGSDHRRPQPHAAGLVRVLRARRTLGTFRSLDGFIRRRLRALLRKQEKRPGFGRCVERPTTLAKCLLRGSRAVHPASSLRSTRDTPDEETNDWRAVCGKTARTVRREGRRKPSLPLSR